MSLKGVMHISGMGGLHKVIAQTKTGFVAESLIDKKRFAVNSTQRVSMLEDISVFTTGEDVKLAEVFKKMQGMNQDNLSLDKDADGATTMNYFSKILPDFDKDRVYASDIKKIAKWYEIVKDMLVADDENASTENTTNVNKDNGDEKEASAPVKTTKKKKKEE